MEKCFKVSFYVEVELSDALEEANEEILKDACVDKLERVFPTVIGSEELDLKMRLELDEVEEVWE